MTMNEKNNQQNASEMPNIYDAFDTEGSTLAFLKEIHDSIKSREFLKKVDYSGEKTCDYLEILKDIIGTLDTSNALDACKAEALTDVFSMYEGFTESLVYEMDCHTHEDFLKKWKDALNAKFPKVENTVDVYVNDLCEVVYLGILEGEIEPLLVFREFCKRMNVEFPVFESIKLAALSAVYDIYEACVREQDYTDGDFESPECQEFYHKWQEAIKENLTR